jgi:intracellular septation protein A
MLLWINRRRFTVEGHAAQVVVRLYANAMESRLELDGAVVAQDRTDFFQPGGTRNHRLVAALPDGRMLEAEAGYIDAWRTGAVARLDGALVYESHPGRPIGLPKGLAEMNEHGASNWKRNKPSLLVDIGLGVLFFVVAKNFDLTTAAVVGAVAGLALVIIQRFVKVDLTGGLALFGVFTLMLSAGFALAFQDDWAVKMRTTVIGCLVAGMFLTDGLLGGRYLGKRLVRYMPYPDIDAGRLAIGLGASGLIMAGLNYVVARMASTDLWLYYTTFGDVVVAMLLFFFGVLPFARVPKTAEAVAGSADLQGPAGR